MTPDASAAPERSTLREPDWPTARERAYQSGTVGPPRRVSLAEGAGCVLATDLLARNDLPAFDSSSMDGWAIAGAPPWRVTQTLLAGDRPRPLLPGESADIATGAQIPVGTDAVLRRERGVLTDRQLMPANDTVPLNDKDIRRRAEEAREGEVLLPSGTVVTPVTLGLAAAAGHDWLMVYPQPTVDVFIMGDELLMEGTSGDGRLRDALAPQAAGWLTSVGAVPASIRQVPDDHAATVDAIRHSDADLVMTTGGTARGPVDQLHPALTTLGATLIVDQVAVRPGHPMVLARLLDGRPAIGLPGNPLAAAVGFVSLAWPLIDASRGVPLASLEHATLSGDISAPPHSHRLLPSKRQGLTVTPVMHHGPAMLSGLAEANVLAVAPPGGASDGETVSVLPLPWSPR